MKEAEYERSVSILSDSLNIEILQTCLAGVSGVSRSTNIYQVPTVPGTEDLMEINTEHLPLQGEKETGIPEKRTVLEEYF